nr:IS21-like element helper ATPase IstB [Novosphingobium olei]
MPRALEALDHTMRCLERGEMTALEAIDILLSHEHGNRESRRFTMGVKTSRLVPMKTIEGFDFSFQPSLDRSRIIALAQLDFIERGEVVHLLGPPGTGKSHLATALGVEAVRAGKRVYRASLAEVIDMLVRAERDGRLPERLRFFNRNSLLIIDEIGYLPVTPGGANLFFQLVNSRYEKGAMILTSNRGFAEWGDVFGDPVVATALLDRLLHHAIVIQIEGASYRLRAHTDLIPEHTRTIATITPPPPPRRRGRPPKERLIDHRYG